MTSWTPSGGTWAYSLSARRTGLLCATGSPDVWVLTFAFGEASVTTVDDLVEAPELIPR